MADLVIKHAGTPILILRGERLAAFRDHIVNGYPELVGEFRAGNLSAEEVADASAVAVEKPPATEEVVWKAFTRDLLGYMWTLENRLRVLEGKALVTREQFLDAVKARLGL